MDRALITQKAKPTNAPINKKGNGHGCGHN